MYHSSRHVCKEKVSDIIYFERTGRKIVMYSRSSEAIAIYGSLAEIYNLLYDEGFEYINKSVVVNFYGNYIEISRSRRTFIMDKFFDVVK